MRRTVELLSVLAGLAFLGWFGLDWYRQRQPTTLPMNELPGDAQLVPAMPSPPRPDDPVTAPADAADAEIEYPVQVPTSVVPLPPLADSDGQIRAALSEILSPETYAEFFQIEGIARKFVLSVDNLTAGKLSLQHRLVKPLAGRFVVAGTDENFTLDPTNYARYDAIVRLVTALDTVALTRLYRLFYPLLQQAYEDLGYPGRYFNDRLVAVIDHLLAATPPATPVALVQPKVYYRFADADLEAASVGHKALMRIGPQHSSAVQQWLRSLRTRLAHADPDSPSD